jgi:hypothetical protein
VQKKQIGTGLDSWIFIERNALARRDRYTKEKGPSCSSWTRSNLARGGCGAEGLGRGPKQFWPWAES